MTRKEIRAEIREVFPDAVVLSIRQASKCLGVEWHTAQKNLEHLPWFEVKKGQKSYAVKDIVDYLYVSQKGAKA